MEKKSRMFSSQVFRKSRKVSFSGLSLILALTFSSLSSTSTANAGVFDCVKAKKWSNYSKLRSAYLKDPSIKTQEDWFNAYVFATIFTGYPKCFNSRDVKVMREFADLIIQTCANGPKWNFACYMMKSRGPLADWAYDSYK